MEVMVVVLPTVSRKLSSSFGLQSTDRHAPPALMLSGVPAGVRRGPQHAPGFG
jgi:hypothetical protein